MLLIGNGTVVTRDSNSTFLEQGAVLIKENRIKEVGNFDYLKEKYKDAEFIDARGGLIMPGLINTHNHIYSAFARGLSIPGNNPGNFLEILEGTWWKIDRKLTLKQVELSALATYMDCIKNGVTTVFDHHASFGNITGSLFEIAKAAKFTGVRTCLSYEISDRDGLDKMKEAVQENVDFIDYCEKDNSGMLAAMAGMHASFTLSENTLNYCLNKIGDKAGYHIHVAEGESDALHCREHYHMSIVERLKRSGILGEKTIAAHCVHIDEKDMELLKETDTMVVHNPESNMGNAVGCPKVLSMFEKGILLGLGTDGYTNDMLESLKVANILHKHETKNPSAAWMEIPQMLYYNNRNIASRTFSAKNKVITNQEDVYGCIQKGALADVIIMDYKPFTPINAKNINSHILFGMNGKDTITTIVNGKVLMKDRKFIYLDEESIDKECREEAKNLWKNLS